MSRQAAPSVLDPHLPQFVQWLDSRFIQGETTTQYCRFLRRLYSGWSDLAIPTPAVEAYFASSSPQIRASTLTVWRHWVAYCSETFPHLQLWSPPPPEEKPKSPAVRLRERLANAHRLMTEAFSPPNPEPPCNQVYGFAPKPRYAMGAPRPLMLQSFGWDCSRNNFGYLSRGDSDLSREDSDFSGLGWVRSYPGQSAQALLWELVTGLCPQFAQGTGWIRLCHHYPAKGPLGYSLALPAPFGSAVPLDRLVDRLIRIRERVAFPPLSYEEKRAVRTGHGEEYGIGSSPTSSPERRADVQATPELQPSIPAGPTLISTVLGEWERHSFPKNGWTAVDESLRPFFGGEGPLVERDPDPDKPWEPPLDEDGCIQKGWKP